MKTYTARYIALFAAGCFAISMVRAQAPLSQQMSETAMRLWPDSFALPNDKYAKWRYDQGVILKGIEAVWLATGDARWFSYIQKSMDFYVKPDGSIKHYRPEEYNIDHINNGKNLLTLYRVTGKEKYRKAAALLRSQLRTHPRTSAGGFWHKNIYTSQMWLDGLYMGQPFYAEYAQVFGEDTTFNDVARQFRLMYEYALDKKTGLLYHGWDESRAQQWADKETGQSPNFWGRSLGWYGMALVDALDYFPLHHPQRKELVDMLHRFCAAVIKVQDDATGLWYDVPDQPEREKNYPEASASCMLTYTFAKGVRKGYLPASFLAAAQKGYAGIIKAFIEKTPGGVNLKGTVSVSGLGGKPYRDGSFAYYMSEPVIVNDPKGIGAFILCAAEMEMAALPRPGSGKTVLLDYFYNNEWKNDATGRKLRWHYTWEDRSNSGYALLGHLFEQYGATTLSLETKPSKSRLAKAELYIIVDPDTEKETAQPNYLQKKEIKAIRKWVRKGGVLVLLGNDAGNAEFTHWNKLAGEFGIRFNEDNHLAVKNDDFRQGEVKTGNDNIIFKTAAGLYLKEISSLSVKPPAAAVLKQNDMAVMAVSRYGKGTVFALGDPWIYNEYLDGRKLPLNYENYKAAGDWVQWLLQQAK
ncbi:MAG TPA: glycoside hydrolase family 88 protein [Chitinophagaceae bacterium]|nr:glycoside hydrolase family 88 protein [Chitinophagaceae bacterium]